MKNLFKYIIPCLAVALTLTSCYDTKDDKAGIDASYESKYATPTASIQVTAPAHNTVNVSLTVDDPSLVAEQGIQLSMTNDFAEIDTYVNDTIEAVYSEEIGGFEELTTVYVRGYAMGRNGQVVYTSVQSITTPEAPQTPLAGTYTVIEVDRNNAGAWVPAAETYQMTVAFEEGSEEIVNITNIWDGGKTVQGVYDVATHTITVPNYQILYVHPSYGEVWIQGFKPDMSDYSDAVTFTFNPRGGRMVSTPMGAICALGAFGYFYLDMQHD